MSYEVKVTRRELYLASQYLYKNDEHAEFEYIQVTNEKLISTNTSALAIIEHDDKQKTPFSFFVHKKAVDLGLSQSGVDEFILEPFSVACMGKGRTYIRFETGIQILKYPDTSRIIKEDFKISTAIHDESHISGILAINEVMINKKYIPKGLTELGLGHIFVGDIMIDNRNSPIMIRSRCGREVFVIMPIIDDSLFSRGLA